MQNADTSGKSGGKSSAESSGDRLLAVLGLFTIERPRWAVEEAAEQLGVSPATCYRYFKRLTNAGMISPVSGAQYTLGPAIIAMDRQIQISDPMLRAARGVMHGLIQQALEGSTAMLCRLFHDRVMCVHQVFGRGPQEPVAYERGRPMPLFRGATSKAILAHLPPRKLKSLYENHAEEIGQSWDEFRTRLAEIRRSGYAVSRREIDPHRIGLGAPVFDKDRAILGSLSFALSYERTDEAQIQKLAPLLMAGAREVERLMDEEPASQGVSPARLRVAREA